MELKLKKRELRLTMYDETVEVMNYPTADEHQAYVKRINELELDDYEETKKFLGELGLSENSRKTLEQPDLMEIISILTGQKKI
tara:strand:+ start:335 stop:586 length:252 start_codon:yes stop_codon:yes gene_type:complete